MGQGQYVALGFGILDTPFIEAEEGKATRAWQAAIGRAAGQRVHSSYESARPYLAIFVAENAGVDDTAKTLETCLLEDAANGEAWDKARATWLCIQAASAALGVVLPEGRPLLIADYD